MKIRNGFVSNSSSSSFVVAFKEIPKTVGTMEDLLFGDIDEFGQWEKFPVRDAARRVFEDLKAQKKPLTKEQIVEEFAVGYINGYPEINSFYKDKEIDWEAYKKAVQKNAEKEAKKFMNKNKDRKFYIFSYSDKDGAFMCEMEHSGIFDNLPHVCISRH